MPMSYIERQEFSQGYPATLADELPLRADTGGAEVTYNREAMIQVLAIGLYRQYMRGIYAGRGLADDALRARMRVLRPPTGQALEAWKTLVITLLGNIAEL